MEWTFVHWRIRVSRVEMVPTPAHRTVRVDKEAMQLLRAQAQGAQARALEARQDQARRAWLWQGWI